MKGSPLKGEVVTCHTAEKSVVAEEEWVPVLQTDTGRQGAKHQRVASQPQSRNSAKWPRNFGRRGARVT